MSSDGSLFFELFPENVLERILHTSKLTTSNRKASSIVKRLNDGRKLEKDQLKTLVENGTRFCKYKNGTLRAQVKTAPEMEVVEAMAEFYADKVQKLALKISPPCGGRSALRGYFQNLREFTLVDEFCEFEILSVIWGCRDTLRKIEISGTMLTEQYAGELRKYLPKKLSRFILSYKHWGIQKELMIRSIGLLFSSLQPQSFELLLPYRVLGLKQDRDHFFNVLYGTSMQQYNLSLDYSSYSEESIAHAFSVLARTRLHNFREILTRPKISTHEAHTVLNKFSSTSRKSSIFLIGRG